MGLGYANKSSKPVETVAIEGEIMAVTEKAFLFKVHVGTEEIEEWIPKSQLSGDGWEDLEKGDTTELVIPLWLAEKKGLT